MTRPAEAGGILLNSALHLKEQKKEYRTLKLYGQELNLIMPLHE